MVETTARSEADTQILGEKFAKILQAGDSVWLSGELGSGKTVFVRGVVAGLGYNGSVTSPTFTLVHEYPADVPIFHIDCFRIRSMRDFLSLGIEDYLVLCGIYLVEWADLISDYFNQWSWKIDLNFVQGEENQRQLCFSQGEVGKSNDRQDKLKAVIAGLPEVSS